MIYAHARQVPSATGYLSGMHWELVWHAETAPNLPEELLLGQKSLFFKL